MKVAMFAPFFRPDPAGRFSNYFEYWLKSAAANSEIDFYIPTNLDITRHTKYDNIYYLYMTNEEFWGKIQAILNFPISHDYYKTGEYRVFFGIIFENILRDYDYWGMTEFDMIYGDILKFIKPHLEKGSDIVGRTASFRVIKNTNELRYMPFIEMKGFSHPLTLKTAFLDEYTWFFSEAYGMNIIYQQNGVNMVNIDDHYGDIAIRYKYFSCNGMKGAWGFNWENGKLVGYNNLDETREFLAIHLQKRKVKSPDELPSSKFCIIPNIICNNVKDIQNVKVNSTFYTILSLWRTNSSEYSANKKLDSESKLIKKEITDYSEKNGLCPPPQSESIIQKFLHSIKRKIIG